MPILVRGQDFYVLRLPFLSIGEIFSGNVVMGKMYQQLKLEERCRISRLQRGLISYF
jgi:hypothetical protein